MPQLSSPTPTPSLSAYPSIRTFLTRSTRTPIYAHPLRWTDLHLSILRIVCFPSPPPDISTPLLLPSGFVDLIALVLTLRPLYSIEPFSGIRWLLSSTLESLDRPRLRSDSHHRHRHRDPHRLSFSRPGSLLTLSIAEWDVMLEPLDYTARGGVPFLAYNDPAHRHQKREALKRRRWPTPYSATGEIDAIDPFDVAVLIALAQAQARLLGGLHFTTQLLYPSNDGRHVHHLTANVSARYLERITEPESSLDDQLRIYRAPPVPITESGLEFLELVRGVVRAAPVGKAKGSKAKKKLKQGGQNPQLVVADKGAQS